MNRILIRGLLGTAMACVLQSGAFAQTVDTAAAARAEDRSTVDIIVTARRSEESLQEVPETVTAVTDETIKKLNFTNFQDIAAVVPGLTLGTGSASSGGAPAPSLRGVSQELGANAGTVDIYINEVPVDTYSAFQAIYDVGSIEVLRGPQGTLRGRTAPSGAITIATRKPDAVEWGGYFSALGTTKNQINAQGAINVPLVRDKLALRVAGLVDQNDGNFVHTVNGTRSPFVKTESARASLAFTPSDNFDATITYQWLHLDKLQYGQYVGTGTAGLAGSLIQPLGYNGPAIEAGDRLSPDESPQTTKRTQHFVSAQVNWEFGGHRLSYIGGTSRYKQVNSSEFDLGNLVIGNPVTQMRATDPFHSTTHEVRLSTIGKGNLIDYVVGYFHSSAHASTTVSQPASALAGAFGRPGTTPDPNIFNLRYVPFVNVDVPIRSKENSFYGNATLHIGDRTDISGGARYIIAEGRTQQIRTFTPAFNAVALPFPCAFVPGAVASPYGAGVCDFPVQIPSSDDVSVGKNKPVMWDVSLTHRFSDNLMAYATAGSSFRGGGAVIGLNAGTDPVLRDLQFFDDERSVTYEAGVKSSWLNNRLRVNLSVFRQNFDGLIFKTPTISYLNTQDPANPAVNLFEFTVNAKAVVTGLDLDVAFQPNSYFNIAGTFSYADGKVDNDTVPCQDGNFDGTPDSIIPTVADFQAAGQSLAFCRTNDSVSRDPIWSGTVQSEFTYPVGEVDAYLRGLASIFPSNSRRSIGYDVPSYALVNVYAGIRSPDAAWDVGIFVRNAFNQQTILSRANEDAVSLNGAATDSSGARVFGRSGFFPITYTPPREFGLSVRYSFGSR
ncbi:TonB-dependent receptor [Novosphingobium pentaromativorans]|uniref:TonB-dependent receptor n=1 Tax=Novosphingobium pentaromativorans TaxID=205844 RepID=UPI0009D9C113|nr:TonB-dependent receptor [Novosphingobium pentaromativorans]